MTDFILKKLGSGFEAPQYTWTAMRQSTGGEKAIDKNVRAEKVCRQEKRQGQGRVG